MIDKKEVQHMAKLARLKLTSKEIKKYQKQLGQILDYVGQLKKVNTKKVAPCTGGTDLQNVFRQDEPRKTSKEMRKKLLNSAPIRKGDFIKTKAVFKKDK